MSSLGKKLEELRKNAGITQEDLAFSLGVSRQTVYRWEAGIRIPNANQINSLCEVLKVSTTYLLSNNDSELKSEQSELAVSENSETTEAETNSHRLLKRKKLLLNIGLIFSVLIFVISSLAFLIISIFTFINEGGVESVLIIDGIWLLIVLLIISIISLVGIILFAVLKKRNCNRLVTQKLQTNYTDNDKIKEEINL